MELKTCKVDWKGRWLSEEAHSKTLEELAGSTTWQLRLSTAMRLRIRKLQLVSKTEATQILL